MCLNKITQEVAIVMKLTLSLISVTIACHSSRKMPNMPKTYEEACASPGLCTQCVTALSRHLGSSNVHGFCTRLTNMACCAYAIKVGIFSVQTFTQTLIVQGDEWNF